LINSGATKVGLVGKIMVGLWDTMEFRDTVSEISVPDLRHRLLLQGNSATGRCTIARSGQAAANFRMYLRWRGESRGLSGKAVFREGTRQQAINSISATPSHHIRPSRFR
jgi:hypothetical protein